MDESTEMKSDERKPIRTEDKESSNRLSMFHFTVMLIGNENIQCSLRDYMCKGVTCPRLEAFHSGQCMLYSSSAYPAFRTNALL